ncbi:prolyl oligopeptidase family serine peptidase [Nonomuraea sp. NPDC050536]|uniref:prolyl oligopeptidase family serine peptidase n=1 Tax=Nonomuraea sp. NPDC050536 TaxID=3364366 RepID=UPI0037CA29E0
MKYPQARRDGVTETFHGRPVADPYRWLEDPDSEDTRSWLRDQQSLSVGYLEGLPGRQRFARMLRDLAPRGAEAAVKYAGARRFRVAEGELQVWEAGWRTVVAASGLHPDAVIARWHPSPAGSLVAVQVRVAGAEDRTPLSLVDVATGQVVESIPDTRYSPVEWRADEKSFFYTRGAGVHHHTAGGDEQVIGDEAATTRYHVALWHDRWLVVAARDGTARARRTSVADVRTGGLLQPLSIDADVAVDADGRLLATCGDFGQVLAGDGRGPWRVLVPEDSTVLLGITLTSTRLVALRHRDGVSRMTVHDPATGALLAEAGLPGEGTVSWVRPTGDPEVLALGYASWDTPPSVWHLDARTGRVTPYGPPPARVDVEVSRHAYRSADGTEVPLTILSHGARGPRPTILAVYGGFGVPARPAYQPDLLAWVLSGGCVAVAGVRGGGERGRRWHEDGRGANKPTALADLHAAGDWLVRHGWSPRHELALLGGSNGGLLAMAAAVQRPAAYAVVGCAGAPFDMIRYERWGLGAVWREEYGSPEDPAEFEALLGYSPYHNVSRGHPAAILITGSNDTRVDPLHSRKMAARLQRAPGRGPVLHYAIEGAGHTGAGGERGIWRSAAALAFVARHTGLAV